MLKQRRIAILKSVWKTIWKIKGCNALHFGNTRTVVLRPCSAPVMTSQRAGLGLCRPGAGCQRT